MWLSYLLEVTAPAGAPANANETSSLPGLASADTEKQKQACGGGAPGRPALPLGSGFFSFKPDWTQSLPVKTWIYNSPLFLFRKGLLLGKVESEFEVKS